MNKKGALESLLFVAGDDGLSMDEITSLLETTPLVAQNLLTEMRASHNDNIHSGLTLIETRKRYQLATKREYAELIKMYAVSPFATHLSQAALETLAIIAYKQPLTRMEIDQIRGVQSAGLVQRLLLRGLIKEIGRSETPGRPIIYGTTDYFMNYFGLTTIDDLPNVDELFQMQDNESFDLFDFPIDENQDSQLAFFKADSVIPEQE
jgi:segregation and condensation protein B